MRSYSRQRPPEDDEVVGAVEGVHDGGRLAGVDAHVLGEGVALGGLADAVGDPGAALDDLDLAGMAEGADHVESAVRREAGGEPLDGGRGIEAVAGGRGLALDEEDVSWRGWRGRGSRSGAPLTAASRATASGTPSRTEAKRSAWASSSSIGRSLRRSWDAAIVGGGAGRLGSGEGPLDEGAVFGREVGGERELAGRRG